MTMKSNVRANQAQKAGWIILLMLTGLLPCLQAQPTVTTTNLPAYESFATSYAEGENLGITTLPTSSGWVWAAGNTASSSSARIFAAAALSYPSLLTEDTTTSRGLKGGTGTGKNRSFYFNPAVNTNAGNVLYASFLFSLQTPNPTGPRLFTCLSSGGGTGPSVDAGVYIDTANHLLVGKGKSVTDTTLPTTLSSPTYSLVASNTYLVVLRYKFNAGSSTNDEVALWLNPTSLGNNAAVPAPSITTTNGNDTTSTLKTFNYLSSSTAGLNTAVPFYMDEIRIGTNWADVTPTNSIAGNLYTVTGGGDGCVGSSFPVNLSGSDANVSYLLYTNGVYSGVSISGTGSPIGFGPQNATATYTVFATNNVTAGVSWMPGSAAITVLQVPTFSAQSGSVVAATNSTVQFTVTSGNLNIGYLWYRNGSPLSDGGNVSGSATSVLTLSPVLAANAATTANGYYCIITNTCGYQAISSTNALTIQLANNLVWQGTPTNLWDVATSASWTNSAGAAVVFNQGDNVLLDDTAQNTTVSLASPYLSPGNITYNGSSTAITISGSGKILGANSSLIVNGPTSLSHLTIANANSFGGGTVINDGWVTIGNNAALGTGTITMTGTGLALLDGVPIGGPNVGIPGINVLADSQLKFAGNQSYSAVVVGPLTGTTGKTLTLNGTAIAPGSNFRVYHTNFTCNCNLALSFATGGNFAPYNGAGTQVYNGVISGNGTLYTRNSGGTIILNGANTYSGGTLLSLGVVGVGINSTSSDGPFGPDTNPVQMELSGNINLFASGGAHVVSNPLAYRTTTNTATLIFSGTNQFTWSGPIDLSTTVGDLTGTNRIIQVDNTAPAILSGVISDQSTICGLTKTGNGALYLNNGGNSYGGTTMVSAGRLAGSGNIPGALAVTNGAIGGGSAVAIGTLTVGGNVTLSGTGGGFFRVNGSSSDLVSVTGTLVNTGTGTITVTNLGAPLTAGQSFTLFNKAVSGGNTMTVTGGGVTWTNHLAVDGTIVTGPAVAAQPPVITSTMVSGGNIVISGNNGTAGASFSVLSSTSLTTPRAAWMLETSGTFGAGGTFSVSIPVSTSTPAKFYLLKLP